MSEPTFNTIRETPLADCIGATLLDITATDLDEFLAGEPSYVYLHFSNGETLFCKMGVDGEGMVGMLGTGEDEE